MKKMTREEKNAQCNKEAKWTLIVCIIVCLWETIWAFALNGSGKMFMGIPAWCSVSIYGSIVLAIAGCVFLLKKVFVDFEYDEEADN